MAQVTRNIERILSGLTQDASGEVKRREEQQPSGDAELVIEIEVPEGISDEKVIETVGELALRCDNLHRDLGGKGLKIENIEIGYSGIVRYFGRF